MSETYTMQDLAHVGLFISDAERSKEFYTQVLDFETAFEIKTADAHVVFVRKGNLILELVQFWDERKTCRDGVVDHIAIHVVNIEKAAEALREKGIVFDAEEITYAPDFWGNGSKWILFRGPDGEHLELTEIL